MRYPPRPLAFSLRTLLVLVGLLCAWLAHERSAVLEWRAAGRAMSRSVTFFSSAEVERGERLCPTRQPPSILARTSWVRTLFGDEPIQEIWASQAGSDFERDAARLFPEATIRRL